MPEVYLIPHPLLCIKGGHALSTIMRSRLTERLGDSLDLKIQNFWSVRSITKWRRMD
jgi:hypothetical protein